MAGLALLAHHNNPLTRLTLRTQQRQTDIRHRRVPVPMNERQILFADSALINQHLLKSCQRFALFGNQNDPRGIAIQPMNQLQKIVIRANLAKRLDQPERHATPAMHSQAMRFINRKQGVIFIQY